MKYVASCSFGKDSHNTFRPNQTIAQLEDRFHFEVDHTTIFDFIKE